MHSIVIKAKASEETIEAAKRIESDFTTIAMSLHHGDMYSPERSGYFSTQALLSVVKSLSRHAEPGKTYGKGVLMIETAGEEEMWNRIKQDNTAK